MNLAYRISGSFLPLKGSHRTPCDAPSQGTATATSGDLDGHRPPLHLPTAGLTTTCGFTLVEMIMTLAIFLLLAGAVFEFISGVLQGASDLQDNRNNRDEVIALNEYLQKNLRDLPAQSILVSYRRGDGEGLLQNGIVFGQDDLVKALDAKVQPNGYYTLRLATFTSPSSQGLKPFQLLEQAVTEDSPTLNWSALIHDVKTISWKFQDANATQWDDLWNNPGNKPNLIEFSLQLAGDQHPVVMDFWLPHLVPVNQGTVP